MDVIVRLFFAVTIRAFTGAQVGVMRFDQERLHPHNFALTEILKRFAIARFQLEAGVDLRMGLKIDKFLRRNSFGLATGSSGTKIVFHLVLGMTVGGSCCRAFDTASAVDGMLDFNGSER